MCVESFKLRFVSFFLGLKVLGERNDFSILFFKFFGGLIFLRFLNFVDVTDEVRASFLSKVNRSNEVCEGWLEF